MTSFENYWRKDKSWRQYGEYGYTLRDDAPPEAKASYELYQKQVKAAIKRRKKSRTI